MKEIFKESFGGDLLKKNSIAGLEGTAPDLQFHPIPQRRVDSMFKRDTRLRFSSPSGTRSIAHFPI